MLKNLKLSSKFNVLLFAVFISAVLLSGVIFSTVLNRYAENQVTEKAELLLQTMLSVREYTNSQITPELSPRLETEPEFLPQTVPGYSAREVIEDLRKHPEYRDFFYKEATLNPTNLRDKADPFETKLVEQFRSNNQLKELSGYRSSPAGDLFYISHPIAITQESCLRCHSTVSAAPASLLATYGRENGFGWELNEIVGAQVISVPASRLIDTARRASLLFIGILALTFALVLLVINWLLKRIVIKPLNRMATIADEISVGNMEADFPQKTNDEIGKLAAAFNRMKTSLHLAMDILRQNG